MKVELKISLELPDNCAKLSKAQLGELLFDAYVNYVTSRHAADALKWCAKARVDCEDEDAGAKRIYEYHELWRDITSNTVWSLTTLGEPAEPPSHAVDA